MHAFIILRVIHLYLEITQSFIHKHFCSIIFFFVPHFTHSYIRPIVQPFTYSFVQSSHHSRIHSFIQLMTHLFMHCFSSTSCTDLFMYLSMHHTNLLTKKNFTDPVLIFFFFNAYWRRRMKESIHPFIGVYSKIIQYCCIFLQSIIKVITAIHSFPFICLYMHLSIHWGVMLCSINSFPIIVHSFIYSCIHSLGYIARHEFDGSDLKFENVPRANEELVPNFSTSRYQGLGSGYFGRIRI